MTLQAISKPRMRGAQARTGNHAMATPAVFAEPCRMGNRRRGTEERAYAGAAAFQSYEAVRCGWLIRDRRATVSLHVTLGATREVRVTDFDRNSLPDFHSVAVTRQATCGRLLLHRVGNDGRSSFIGSRSRTIGNRVLLEGNGANDRGEKIGAIKLKLGRRLSPPSHRSARTRPAALC